MKLSVVVVHALILGVNTRMGCGAATFGVVGLGLAADEISPHFLSCSVWLSPATALCSLLTDPRLCEAPQSTNRRGEVTAGPAVGVLLDNSC